MTVSVHIWRRPADVMEAEALCSLLGGLAQLAGLTWLFSPSMEYPSMNDFLSSTA